MSVKAKGLTHENFMAKRSSHEIVISKELSEVSILLCIVEGLILESLMSKDCVVREL